MPTNPSTERFKKLYRECIDHESINKGEEMNRLYIIRGLPGSV